MATPPCPSCGKAPLTATDHCAYCGAVLVPGGEGAGPGAPIPSPTEPFTPLAICPLCHTPNPLGSVSCRQCQQPLRKGAYQVALFDKNGQRIGVVASLPVRAVAYVLDWLLLVMIGVIVVASGVSIEKTDIGLSRADFLSVGVDLLYSVVCWSVSGRTLGKAVFGLRVVRPDGSTISAGRAFLRYLGTALSALTLLAGYLMIVLRKDRRALHDLMADTYVIRR